MVAGAGGDRVVLEWVTGDITQQRDVDAIVNAWNRNFVPRWLLLPQGVSGALKRVTGPGPWRQLARAGMLPVGGAVVTDGGELPVHLIHVAGLTATWRASERSVSSSVQSALTVAHERGWQRLAMPLIGSGTGGLTRDLARTVITKAALSWSSDRVPHAGPPMLVRVVTLPD